MNIDFDLYVDEAWELLKSLIAIPSFSGDESKAAALLYRTMHTYGITTHVEGNNLYAFSPRYDSARPTILLTAHIDTVKPAASWTYNPFAPTEEDDRLYGLGSNDCGGALVSLLQVFRILYAEEIGQDYNFIFVASCEEEISGANGISLVLPKLPKIDVALVGEPTSMQPAIAERGLMVLDLVARGVSGHAARNEGVNAIYAMIDDLVWLRSYTFDKESKLLGRTTMQVTQLSAGTQHNVVPDECRAVLDVRTNELYSNEELLTFIQQHCKSEVTARSTRLHSSHIDPHHPFIERCVALGLKPFGSSTLSDQALLSCPSFKLGPGDSARSHSADEYICKSELRQAIEVYLKLLE